MEELQSDADSTRHHVVWMKAAAVLHQNLRIALSQSTSPPAGSFPPSSHNSGSVSWLQAQEESWQRTVRLRRPRPGFSLIFPLWPTAAERTASNRISHLKGRDEGKNESEIYFSWKETLSGVNVIIKNIAE